MKATENKQPHEASNKNNHFGNRLCVANMAPTFYYNEFIVWQITNGTNKLLEFLYKKP